MTTKPKFQIGDIVRLKSGGHQMTVGALPCDVHHSIGCMWHDLDGRPQQCVYYEAMLEPVVVPSILSG